MQIIYLVGGLLFIIAGILFIVVLLSFISIIKFLKKKNFKLLILFSGVYLLLSSIKMLTVRLNGNKIYFSYQPHLFNNLSVIPSDETSLPGGIFARLLVAVGDFIYIPQLDFIGKA